MRLPFLDREDETARLTRLVARREGSVGVLFGRRRCGKSRLLREVLPEGRSVYYVGDEREGPLQRTALAAEIARMLPGFDQVAYPDWDALLARLWNEARPATVLALDELPALVASAPEVPSLLQKHVDRYPERRIHLLLAGSSQRMMQGLALGEPPRSSAAPPRSSRSLLWKPAGSDARSACATPSPRSRPTRSGAERHATGSWRRTIPTSRPPCASWF